MQSNQKQVEEAIEQSIFASDALNAITDTVSNIQIMNSQIATGAEEQQATSEDIQRNIVAIQLVSLQTSNGIQDVQNSVAQLNQLGNELSSSMGLFKTV